MNIRSTCCRAATRALDNLRLEASDAPPPSAIPLPAGLLLLAGGLALIGLLRRRH